VSVSARPCPSAASHRSDPSNPSNCLHLIIEVTGEKKKDKEAKVATAKTLWVPAVNNHGGLGRWAFVEIDDPWDALPAIGRESAKGGARAPPTPAA
jgi:type III restriction enzyme